MTFLPEILHPSHPFLHHLLHLLGGSVARSAAVKEYEIFGPVMSVMELSHGLAPRVGLLVRTIDVCGSEDRTDFFGLYGGRQRSVTYQHWSRMTAGPPYGGLKLAKSRSWE